MKRYTLMIALFLISIAIPALAQHTFVVNSWDDREDLNPGNGICYTIHGECTLRAAIEEVNTTTLTVTPDTEQDVRILMYDTLGRQVCHVFNGVLPSTASTIDIEPVICPMVSTG